MPKIPANSTIQTQAHLSQESLRGFIIHLERVATMEDVIGVESIIEQLDGIDAFVSL